MSETNSDWQIEAIEKARRNQWRDTFAASALAGLLNPACRGGETWAQAWAREAYEIADAMLVEREKRK